jgi:hypothetical protein
MLAGSHWKCQEKDEANKRFMIGKRWRSIFFLHLIHLYFILTPNIETKWRTIDEYIDNFY